jgi:hypothetical protein
LVMPWSVIRCLTVRLTVSRVPILTSLIQDLARAYHV